MIEDTDGGDQLQIKLKNKNWKNKIDQYKLDPTLKWKFAEITEINETNFKFKIINEKINKYRKY